MADYDCITRCNSIEGNALALRAALPSKTAFLDANRVEGLLAHAEGSVAYWYSNG